MHIYEEFVIQSHIQAYKGDMNVYGPLWTLTCICTVWTYFLTMLSSWDPRLIAEIPSDPRSILYRSSDSDPTILQYSDTMLTKTPNSEYPPNPPTHFLSLSELWMTLEKPRSHFCLHLSSSFRFSPLELQIRSHVFISVFTLPFSIY